jgi:hypothetical protein
MSNLVADDAGERVNAVRLFGPLRDAPFQREPFRRIAACRDNRASGTQDARSRNDAVPDRLPQLDIGIARPLGAEIANGREAGFERAPEMVDRSGRTQGETFAQHLIVPLRLVVGVQEDVGVPLDEAGRQGRVR